MEGLNDGFIQWMRPLNRLEDFELDQREPNQSKDARFIDVFRNAWNNVGETRSNYAREQYALSVGCLLYTSNIISSYMPSTLPG